jgi:hypothetical protein
MVEVPAMKAARGACMVKRTVIIAIFLLCVPLRPRLRNSRRRIRWT